MSGGTPPPRIAAGQTQQRAARTSATTAATTASRVTSYTVRPGDTLSKIATHFNTSVEKLRSWNHLTSSRLTVGRKLVVAQQSASIASNGGTGARKVIHRVREGETLDKIATTYNTSVDAILSWNESEDLTVIHPGDRITIFLGDTN